VSARYQFAGVHFFPHLALLEGHDAAGAESRIFVPLEQALALAPEQIDADPATRSNTIAAIRDWIRRRDESDHSASGAPLRFQ